MPARQPRLDRVRVAVQQRVALEQLAARVDVAERRDGELERLALREEADEVERHEADERHALDVRPEAVLAEHLPELHGQGVGLVVVRHDLRRHRPRVGLGREADGRAIRAPPGRRLLLDRRVHRLAGEARVLAGAVESALRVAAVARLPAAAGCADAAHERADAAAEDAADPAGDAPARRARLVLVARVGAHVLLEGGLEHGLGRCVLAGRGLRPLGDVEHLGLACGGACEPLRNGDALLLAGCERQGVEEVAEGEPLVVPRLREVEHVAEAERPGHRDAPAAFDLAAREADDLVAEAVDRDRLVDRHALDERRLLLLEAVDEPDVPDREQEVLAVVPGEELPAGDEHLAHRRGARFDQADEDAVREASQHVVLLEDDVAGLLPEFDLHVRPLRRLAAARRHTWQVLDEVDQRADDALRQRLEWLLERDLPDRRPADWRQLHFHVQRLALAAHDEAEAAGDDHPANLVAHGRDRQRERPELVGDDPAAEHCERVGPRRLDAHVLGGLALRLQHLAADQRRQWPHLRHEVHRDLHVLVDRREAHLEVGDLGDLGDEQLLLVSLGQLAQHRAGGLHDVDARQERSDERTGPVAGHDVVLRGACGHLRLPRSLGGPNEAPKPQRIDPNPSVAEVKPSVRTAPPASGSRSSGRRGRRA